MEAMKSLKHSILTGFVLALNCTGNVSVQAATLVSGWTFEGNYLSSNHDPSYDLIPGGGVTLVSSPKGTAAEFHGGSYPITNPSDFSNPAVDRLDTATSVSSLLYNSGFSVMGIIKPYDNLSGRPILCHVSSSYDFPNYLGGFEFQVFDTVQIAVRDTGDNRLWATADGTPISANNWYHIAVTWDGSASGGFGIYINGQPVSYELRSLGTFTALDTVTPFPIRIGSSQGNSLQEVNAFNGAIEELSLYYGALSPAEVQDDYLSNAAAVPEPSTFYAGFILLGIFGFHPLRKIFANHVSQISHSNSKSA